MRSAFCWFCEYWHATLLKAMGRSEDITELPHAGDTYLTWSPHRSGRSVVINNVMISMSGHSGNVEMWKVNVESKARILSSFAPEPSHEAVQSLVLLQDRAPDVCSKGRLQALRP